MANLFNLTKTIVGGIWDTGVSAYKIAEKSTTDAIDNQTKAELEKSGLSHLSKSDYQYIQKRKEVKKEMQNIGLKGGAIALGVGLFV